MHREGKNELLFDRSEKSGLHNWNGFEVKKNISDERVNSMKVWMTTFSVIPMNDWRKGYKICWYLSSFKPEMDLSKILREDFQVQSPPLFLYKFTTCLP